MLHSVYCNSCKITVKDLKKNRIMFVGTEEECDKFADNNPNYEFLVDSFSGYEFHNGYMYMSVKPGKFDPKNCFAKIVGYN